MFMTKTFFTTDRTAGNEFPKFGWITIKFWIGATRNQATNVGGGEYGSWRDGGRSAR